MNEIDMLKLQTDSKYKNEALIKKRIYDFQENNGFDATFDFLLE